ncbi:hypothetical protein CDEST_14808 [Colletotrichum destructivum]|uniref:Uncharacterized protein n=1 Tax=Colletotrichum destructivum TaxID=34406 RepID=A0AAX4J2Y1_9PEZI|nr:hypothetical protein CDEST_14808 [Colletotrichum destructivum]
MEQKRNGGYHHRLQSRYWRLRNPGLIKESENRTKQFRRDTHTHTHTLHSFCDPKPARCDPRIIRTPSSAMETPDAGPFAGFDSNNFATEVWKMGTNHVGS